MTSESTLPILEALQRLIIQQSSPWKNREEAAAYLKIDVAQFDKLVAKGRIEKRYCVASPRFRTEDLDQLITKEKNPL